MPTAKPELKKGNPNGPASKKYAAPALEKGLDILELFAMEADGLIKSEVARRLKRTTSEVFRMLVCLQDRGYISQSGDEKYTLTLRLFELAQQHPPTKLLITEAMPIMQGISRRTEQSCHLAVIDANAVVILAQSESPSSPGFFIRPGSHVDLMLASSGHVILAHQSSHARINTLEICRQRGCIVPDDFVSHLERIFRQGYEERDSYQVKGVVNISFPVLDHRGEAIAALSVPFLPRIDSDVTNELIVEELRQGAAELSSAMGHRP